MGRGSRKITDVKSKQETKGKGKKSGREDAAKFKLSEKGNGRHSNVVNKPNEGRFTAKSDDKKAKKRKSGVTQNSKAKKKLFVDESADRTLARFTEDGAELELEVAGQSTEFVSEDEEAMGSTDYSSVSEHDDEDSAEEGEIEMRLQSQNNNATKSQECDGKEDRCRTSNYEEGETEKDNLRLEDFSDECTIKPINP